MNIEEYLNENCIKYGVEAASVADAVDLLSELHLKAGNINDKERFKADVLRRESETSTALLSGIALPHAKSPCVIRPALAKITLKAPLLWGGKEVGTIYLLASPDSASHIKMLSALADALQNGENKV